MVGGNNFLPTGTTLDASCFRANNSSCAPASGDCASSSALLQTIRQQDTREREQLCALCMTRQLEQSVSLHPPGVGTAGQRCCVACKKCAAHWRNVCGDERAPALLSCPMCAAAMPITRSISEFSRNSTSGALTCHGESSSDAHVLSSPAQEVTNATETSGVCGVCERAGATKVCVPCGFPLCDPCLESSHMRGGYKAHKIVPFSAAKCMEPEKCERHPPHLLNVYCITCSTVVCIGCCLYDSHKGHNATPLNAFASKLRLEVEEGSRKLQLLASGMHDLALNLEQNLLPRCNGVVNEKREDIKRCFDVLRRALDMREHEVLQEVASRVCRLTDTISLHASQCRAAESAFHHSAKSLQDALTSMGDAEVVHLAEAMKRSAAVIHSTAADFIGKSLNEATEQEGLLSRYSASSDPLTAAQQDDVIKIIGSIGFRSPSNAVEHNVRTTEAAVVAPAGVIKLETPHLKLDTRVKTKDELINEQVPLHEEQQMETFGDMPVPDVRRALMLDWDCPRANSADGVSLSNHSATAKMARKSGAGSFDLPKLRLSSGGTSSNSASANNLEASNRKRMR
uniref:Predicted zinc finger protein n=1 Tax=Trypanosoma congolense (strain IL3000) TaxID=1068625 RepID=G0UWH1_TRYCI|nr:predicted zinc finger protein [Trypanosoma congolense IL3000]